MAHDVQKIANRRIENVLDVASKATSIGWFHAAGVCICHMVSSLVCVGRQFSGRAKLEEAACRELLLQNDLFLKHQ